MSPCSFANTSGRFLDAYNFGKRPQDIERGSRPSKPSARSVRNVRSRIASGSTQPSSPRDYTPI